MRGFPDAVAELGTLDALAARDTPAARLDPRVKVVATLAFVAVVASFGRRDVARLAPLALFPVALGALGDVPWRPLLVRLAVAAPLVLAMGAAELFLDRAPAAALGPFVLSGGAVAFATLSAKLALSIGAALVLVSTTGFDAVCGALGRLGAPRAVVTQLALVHRYAFVIADEARRMVRAHDQRAVRPGALSPRTAVALLGHLLLRAVRRAERVHAAMRCRGFDGTIRRRTASRIAPADVAFAAATAALLLATRALDVPRLLGAAVLGGGG